MCGFDPNVETLGVTKTSHSSNPNDQTFHSIPSSPAFCGSFFSNTSTKNMTTAALWTPVTPYQSLCYLCLHPADNNTVTEKAVFFFGWPQYVASLVFELSHTGSFVQKRW